MRVILSFLAFLIFTSKALGQEGEDQLIKILNDSLRTDPKNSELLFMKGLTYSDSKKYDSAIIYFNDAVKNLKSQINKPIFHDEKLVDSFDILFMRAYCYDLTNQVNKSISDYRYLQRVKPNDFMLSIAVARLYIKHKDFSNAQTEIDRLKNLSYNERGLVYQAILLVELEKYNEALNTINKALEKYPNSIEGLFTKAKVLAKLGKINEACKSINEAKAKITLEYFNGERGYKRDFENEIENWKNLYCK